MYHNVVVVEINNFYFTFTLLVLQIVHTYLVVWRGGGGAGF